MRRKKVLKENAIRIIDVGFTFILEKKNANGNFYPLKKSFRVGNDAYLIQKDYNLFPLLSEFELIDQDAFGPSFMPQLIKELKMVIGQLVLS